MKENEYEELFDLPKSWSKKRKEKFLAGFLAVAREMHVNEKARARTKLPGKAAKRKLTKVPAPSPASVVLGTPVLDLCFHGVSEHDASSVAKAILGALLTRFGLDELEQEKLLGTDLMGKDF